jgi:chemotaxis signal transduction protein
VIATATPQSSPAAGARLVEVLVVRLQEGNERYSFGVLVSQIGALVRLQNATVRPVAAPGPHRVANEALYEDRWLPVYDLAGVLGLLAPWKMGAATTVRPYLLVVQSERGHAVILSVDDVAEIGTCRLDQIHSLPGWLRRQLHPPLIWAGVHGTTLTVAQSEEGASPVSGAAGAAAGLLLLLDCAPLANQSL